MVDLTINYAKHLDSKDNLSKYRDRFYLNENEIYMDGNSLGLLSKDAEESLLRVLEEWKTLGINGWGNPKAPWFYFSESLAALQAPLMGAKSEELIIHSSTTLNLHCLLGTFFKPAKKRNKIMIDILNFPSDRYAIESHMKLRGFDPNVNLIVIESKDGRTLDESYIISKMTDEVSLILLPSVLYRSGQLLDIKILTEEAHKKNIIIGFDCCHSAGSMLHKLSEWNVDFAFWCNYKYFCNGPGGTASIYINEKHLSKGPELAGWFGYSKSKQFDMTQEFVHENTAGAWQVGTPHLLSMAPLEGSLKLFYEAGIDNIRKKSLALTNYLIMLIDNILTSYGFTIGTPREDSRRGGHIALEHDDAIPINEALKANVIRLAPIALYTSFKDVWNVVDIIKTIMENKDYLKYSSDRGTIA